VRADQRPALRKELYERHNRATEVDAPINKLASEQFHVEETHAQIPTQVARHLVDPSDSLQVVTGVSGINRHRRVDALGVLHLLRDVAGVFGDEPEPAASSNESS
jgi:hypothetical protein